MFYLVQGVFFQGRQHLAIDFRSVEGAVPVLREGIFRSMFCGAISREFDPNVFSGSLVDPFGDSVLTNIKLEPSELEPEKFSFTKKYIDRQDTIHYQFEKRVGNVWVGHWHGAAVGTGVAKCKLTEVTDDDFFDFGATLEALGIIKKTKSFNT